MSLTTLYDEASLWMTPSSASDGKLYSQLPTDGSGDFTFSRGSNLAATRVNSLGLIEKGRENLLLQSNQFDNTWNKQSVSVTSGQSGYDSSSDAWTLESSIIGGYIRQYISVSGVNTISIYAKANSTNGVAIRFVGITNNPYVYFDLTNGNLLYQDVSSDIINVNDSESLGGGWYRFSVSLKGSLTQVRVYPSNTSTQQVIGSIYIQDAQLEQGLVATDYIETGASTAQAGVLEDEPRLDYSGGASCPSLLLEPQRSNTLPNSEYLSGYDLARTNGTNNSATSPEGIDNAFKLYADTQTGAHYMRLNYTKTSDAVLSVFAKKGEETSFAIGNASFSQGVVFNLENGTITSESGGTGTIEDMGSDWYRCSYHRTAWADWQYIALRGNNTAYAGDGSSGIYLYGIQLEQGSYPTSYIPTYGTSQTRSVEQLYTLENSSLFDLEQGTFFLEISALEDDNTDRKISISDGTNDNMVNIGFSRFTGNINGEVISNGVLQTSGFAATGVTQDTNNKFALVWGNGEFRFYVNGAKTKELSISNSPVGMDILRFAQGNGSQRNYLNTKQILIFPTTLTDSECIALTIDGLKEDIIASYKTRATTLESGAEDRLDTYLQELEDFIIV